MGKIACTPVPLCIGAAGVLSGVVIPHGPRRDRDPDDPNRRWLMSCGRGHGRGSWECKRAWLGDAGRLGGNMQVGDGRRQIGQESNQGTA